MADMNRITLALSKVTRMDDAQTGRMTIGSPAAVGQPPAFRSFPPCLSPLGQQPGYEPGPRQVPVASPDVDPSVVGAGRPRGRTGVPCHRLARLVRLAIRLGWRFTDRAAVPGGRPGTAPHTWLRTGLVKPARGRRPGRTTATRGNRTGG